MKLSKNMEAALEAIKTDAARKGRNTDLIHGATDTSRSTLLALRDRGLIRFDNVRAEYYETRGRFGRGNVRRHHYSTFTITLLVEV